MKLRRLSGFPITRDSRFTVDIHAIQHGLWQESDELLIYLQIETKYFRLMIRQYFISLTLNCEPGTLNLSIYYYNHIL